VDVVKRVHLATGATQWLGGRRLPVSISCEFSYDVKDPYAVTVIFDAAWKSPVRWVFSRELLTDGVTSRVGEGDVAVWPEKNEDGDMALWLQVGHMSCTAVVELPIKLISKWLARTYALVPRGSETEHVEWDRVIQMIE
jgi:hypothetical protein